jgi:hypothetical protein
MTSSSTITRDDTTTQENSTPEGPSDLQSQIVTYGSKIQDLLEKIRANIQESRFNVERIENGIRFDIALKATIKQNTSQESSSSTTNVA